MMSSLIFWQIRAKISQNTRESKLDRARFSDRGAHRARRDDAFRSRAMAATDAAYQEAVAFLQKTNLDGESVYEQLAKVVGAWPPSSREPRLGPRRLASFLRLAARAPRRKTAALRRRRPRELLAR